jgi:hypothetical protein
MGHIIIIEPGAINTNFYQSIHSYGEGIWSNPTSPYHTLYREYQRSSDGMRLKEHGPEALSKVVMQAMACSKPKVRDLAGVTFTVKMITVRRFILGSDGLTILQGSKSCRF